MEKYDIVCFPWSERELGIVIDFWHNEHAIVLWRWYRYSTKARQLIVEDAHATPQLMPLSQLKVTRVDLETAIHNGRRVIMGVYTIIKPTFGPPKFWQTVSVEKLGIRVRDGLNFDEAVRFIRGADKAHEVRRAKRDQRSRKSRADRRNQKNKGAKESRRANRS